MNRIEQIKARSLNIAMAVNDRRTGEMAYEIGVSPQQLSVWRKYGNYSNKATVLLMGVLKIDKYSDFIKLGESISTLN